MATGTMLAFDHTALLTWNGTVDLANDVLKMSVLTAIPAASSTTYASISGTESANVNQSITLTNSVATVTTNDASLDASNDPVFTATGACTIVGFVIYDDTVTSPLDAVLFYGDIDDANPSIVLASGETVTVNFNASGIALLTNAG